MAKELDDDKLASILVQLGDTIATIVATRAVCEIKKLKKEDKEFLNAN